MRFFLALLRDVPEGFNCNFQEQVIRQSCNLTANFLIVSAELLHADLSKHDRGGLSISTDSGPEHPWMVQIHFMSWLSLPVGLIFWS